MWFCLRKTIIGSYFKQNNSDLWFSNRHHFLEMSKFVAGHVTKMWFCPFNMAAIQSAIKYLSLKNAGCKIIFMCANSLFRGSIGLWLQVAFATKRPLRRRAYAEATISGLETLSRRFSKGQREFSKGFVERRTSIESETFLPFKYMLWRYKLCIAMCLVIGTICPKNWAIPQITFC